MEETQQVIERLGFAIKETEYHIHRCASLDERVGRNQLVIMKALLALLNRGVK